MFDWSQYAGYAEIKKLKKGTVLFQQGDVINGFYYLQEGKVMISMLREDGYERIIDFVYPGTLIGEQLLNGKPSFTNATLLRESSLYFFSKEQFEKLAAKHQETSREFGNSLIQKVRMLVNLQFIENASVEVQLAHFLLNLREKNNKDAIELDQNLIAKYIGKSRVSLWKVLKKWRAESIVEITNGIILLKDVEALMKIRQAI